MPICERHANGLEAGKDYPVIGFAYWFHNFPHVRYYLSPIDSDMFDIFSRQYVTSLAVLAAIILIICIIILVVYFIFSFSVCIFLNKDHQKDQQKGKETKDLKQDKEIAADKQGIPSVWKTVIFCVAALFGFGFFIAMFGVWKVYNGAHNLRNSTRDAVAWFESIKEDFKKIDFVKVNDIKLLANSIRADISSIGLFPNITNKFFEYIDKIIAYANQTNEQVIKANMPLVNLSTIDLEWVDDVETYGTLIWIGCLAGVLCVTIIGLLYTCAVFSPKMLSVMTIVAIIAVISTSCLVATGVSASVLVSDFCMDAKPFIYREIDDPIIYEYIVECPLTDKKWITQGVLSRIKETLALLQGGYSTVLSNIDKVIQTYCEKTAFINTAANFGFGFLKNLIPMGKSLLDFIPDNMNITCPFDIHRRINGTLSRLNKEIDSYNQLIYSLQRIADCVRINKDLYDSLDSLCLDMSIGAVILHYYSIFAFICFLIILFVATYALSQRPSKLQKSVQRRIQQSLPKSKPAKK